MLFTCYPLIHTVFSLPVQPWYALEITCGYILILLVIILQNRLCLVEGLARRCSEMTGAVFCVAALLYGLFSAYLTVPVMEAFSIAVLSLKFAAAAYLLAVSLVALKQRKIKAAPLFYASVFYAAMLVWDRLLPAYEPVLTGWFSEWGGFLMILMIGYTLWRDIVTAYSYNLAFTEEHRQAKRQLAMQMEYMNQVAERIDENRKLSHDFRHHVLTIREIAAKIDSLPETAKCHRELMDYLETLHHGVPTEENTSVLCNRAAVNALLQYYASTARRKNVRADLTLSIPGGLPFSDAEWCTVLGNLLENAFESCERSDIKNAFVRIATKWTMRTFFLLVENSCDGKYDKQDGGFLSRKRGGGRPGIGLISVRDTVERYGGTLDIYPLERVFQAGITLPCVKDDICL